MKRKLIKIIGIILIVFAIFNIYLSYANRSFALGDVTKNPLIWIDKDKDVGEDIINVKAKTITGIIRVFGIIASVITLAIIALRIIFGSTEEKANYKQTLLPWGVGAIMLFAMSTIPSLVYNVTSELDSKEIEVLPATERTLAYFCENNHYMNRTGGAEGQYTCIFDCGAKKKDYHDHVCKKCYNGDKTKLRPLIEMDIGYYCSSCGNVYNK